jgi:hypothetical protein
MIAPRQIIAMIHQRRPLIFKRRLPWRRLAGSAS